MTVIFRSYQGISIKLDANNVPLPRSGEPIRIEIEDQRIEGKVDSVRWAYEGTFSDPIHITVTVWVNELEVG